MSVLLLLPLARGALFPALTCLGPCQDCYLSLRELGENWLDCGACGPDEVRGWVADLDLCRVDRFFTLGPGSEATNLAKAGGRDQLKYPGYEEDLTSAEAYCRATQDLALALLDGADPSKTVRAWRGEVGALTSAASGGGPLNNTASVLSLVTQEVLDLVAEGGGALQVSALLRSSQDRLRVLWGLKATLHELSSSLPVPPLPRLVWHSEVYGRHWDVLSWLIRSRLGAGRVRMAEVGVACGPVPVVLLQRFPELEYLGADPQGWPDEVKMSELRRVGGGRARVLNTTSSALGRSLPDRSLDLVFIDGPHTFSQVYEDIWTWQLKVRDGGLLAGHDLTLAHPPLQWAVLRAKAEIAASGAWADEGEVHVAMDGVWWWEVRRAGT
jgi:hypothetical protein